MVSANIKFAIATERLSDPKEDWKPEPRARKFVDGDEDLQNWSAEEDHDL